MTLACTMNRMTPTQALRGATIVAARAIGLESEVGSLEPGKDADFAVWSKSPLDSETVCLQTWIDGKKYFDRSLSADHGAKLEKERAELLVKAKKLAKLSGGGEGGSGEDKTDYSFFRVSLEHEFDGCERHCLDED